MIIITTFDKMEQFRFIQDGGRKRYENTDQYNENIERFHVLDGVFGYKKSKYTDWTQNTNEHRDIYQNPYVEKRTTVWVIWTNAQQL